jgi:phosphoribosyl 1,2-cyclic phosphate phosphodiesterase
MMNMNETLRVTILGSGTSSGVPVIGCQCATCISTDPRDKRMRTSVMIERGDKRVIIDTSNDFRMQMLAYNVRSADAIVFTHHHYDHISGFDDIRAFNYVTRKPMECYATEETFSNLKKFFAYAFQTSAPQGGGVPQTILHTVQPGEKFSVAGMEITSIPLKHGTLDVMGYRVGNIAYCTDCNAIPESSYALMEGLEYLVIDALRYTKHPTHFTVDEAIEVAQRINAKHTYFTHIAHEIKHEEAEKKLPEGIKIAYDGLVMESD